MEEDEHSFLLVLRVDGREQEKHRELFHGEGANMSAKLLGLPGLTVDELIQALQKLSDEGYGEMRTHALMGAHTGPIRGVGTVPSWDTANRTVALVMADDDNDTAGNVLQGRV
nr:hypothetical protein [uncultured Cupriavidus sp.]